MPTKCSGGYKYSVEEIKSVLDKGLENIMRMYAHATQFEIEEGIAWYRIAYEQAVDIANRYKLPIETVVKVACAISPKMSWKLNMKAAEFYVRYYLSGGYVPDIEPYATGNAYLQNSEKSTPDKPVISKDSRLPKCPYGGLKANAVKALWILQGHEWVLRGPKVQPFCDNILRWNDSQYVTVDSHAIQVWFGSLEGGTYGIPENYMKVIAADYIRAAELLGLSPLQVQAITWKVKKNRSKYANR